MLQASRDPQQPRDPGAFRSWLVTIAMRQVGGLQRARRAWPRTAPPEEAELADPALDFADLSNAPFQLIVSYNELGEGTAVESATRLAQREQAQRAHGYPAPGVRRASALTTCPALTSPGPWQFILQRSDPRRSSRRPARRAA